jgi:hypothetical protein
MKIVRNWVQKFKDGVQELGDAPDSIAEAEYLIQEIH